MDKQQEESRRQFEEWWEKFYETSPREPWDVIYSPEHDYYCDQDVDGQYDAWKASRASIVVEPTHFVLKNEITGPWGCDEDLRCYTLELDASKAKDDFGGEIIPVIELRSIGLSIKGE